jgi:hypothetical protein
MKQEAVSNNIHKKRKNPPLKERGGYMLLRGVGQALLSGGGGGFIRHASSTLSRKGPSDRGIIRNASSTLKRKEGLCAAK